MHTHALLRYEYRKLVTLLVMKIQMEKGENLNCRVANEFDFILRLNCDLWMIDERTERTALGKKCMQEVATGEIVN